MPGLCSFTDLAVESNALRERGSGVLQNVYSWLVESCGVPEPAVPFLARNKKAFYTITRELFVRETMECFVRETTVLVLPGLFSFAGSSLTRSFSFCV